MNLPTVLAIDPGRAKCGVAVVDLTGAILHRCVISTESVDASVDELFIRFLPQVAIIGDGTGTADIVNRLATVLKCPLHVVDEKHTSEAARDRYLKENAPKGLGRIVPPSLRVPDKPYDDYVAVILAERWLELNCLP